GDPTTHHVLSLPQQAPLSRLVWRQAARCVIDRGDRGRGTEQVGPNAPSRSTAGRGTVVAIRLGAIVLGLGVGLVLVLASAHRASRRCPRMQASLSSTHVHRVSPRSGSPPRRARGPSASTAAAAGTIVAERPWARSSSRSPAR